MRWMRGLTLAGVAMLAGCLEAKTVHCANGVVCPEGMACALAPVYCEAPARVEACAGADDFTMCTLEGGAGACRGGACFPCVDNELAGCEHSGWFPMASGTMVDLKGVWTAGPGEAYAVGKETVVSYDGFRWTTQNVTGADFTAVWGSTADHVFATTLAGKIYRRMADGAWDRVYPGTDSLVAITGTGPDDVIALGIGGAIVRSAGAGWRTEMIALPPLDFVHGIAAQSRDDVFVVGGRGAVYRSTGATWAVSRAPSSTQVQLNAVAATPTSVFAIGNPGTTNVSAVRLPAGQATWMESVIPNVPGKFFKGIWASAEDEAFAVGQSGQIVRYSAGAWAPVDQTPGSNLNAIHGSDRRNVFAVGVGGTILRYTGP